MTARTIVITTTEEANAMLAILEREKELARECDYARERARRIKWMNCTCCGESYQGRQWWNQDQGFGLGDCCVDMCGASRIPQTESECYGVAGIHFLIESE